MRTDPEVQRALNRYRLGLPRMPVSGRSGELLGRGTGASLEFREYREYAPGDDIRHVDWAAYARSDSLMVRLFREEISPRMDVLLDVSRSMTTSQSKTLLARQLAAVFALMSGAAGSQPSISLLGDERPTGHLTLEMIEQLEAVRFDAVAPIDALLAERAVPLKRHAVRVLISDFLFPHEPGSLIRRLAGGASVLWVIQILSEWEAHPEAAGGQRLVDIESRRETDLLLNRQVVAGYLQRLHRLQDELSLHCRRHHSTFVPVIADDGLQAVCEELCRSEVLRAS